MIELTLPVPPSANRYWRFTTRGVLKSDVARQYAWQVIAIANQCEPLEGDLKLTIDVYRPRKAGDLDNYLKCIGDSLQGIAYENDSQIVEIHARRFDDKINPRVEVKIESVNAKVEAA